MPMMQITSPTIRELREALGESQAAFATRFGRDQSTIHRWETKSPPRDLMVLNQFKKVMKQAQRANGGLNAG